jgi:hypothetical protein
MKIYISGPITHEPNADENFKKAHIILSKMYPNAEIRNPILIPSPKYSQDDWGKDGLWSYFMHESIKMMMGCDTIFLLKNWAVSKGATIEHDLAWKLDMNIMYEEELNISKKDETSND